VAAARTIVTAQTDTHDDSEADTRDTFLDLLFNESIPR
jgi:hypothetical protein